MNKAIAHQARVTAGMNLSWTRAGKICCIASVHGLL